MKVFLETISCISDFKRLHFDASFMPYLHFLQLKMEKSTDIRIKFYRYIISKFRKEPQLLLPIKDMTLLEKHQDLIQLLRMSLLPLAANSDEYSMALAFIKPSCIFYYTDPFSEWLEGKEEATYSKDEQCADLIYLMRLVIERCYHVKLEGHQKRIKQFSDTKKHLIRHLHLKIDSRFIEVHTIDDLPAFDERWLEVVSSNTVKFEEVAASFPFEKFRFTGFCILLSEDVSKEVAINDLKNAILNMHNDKLEQTLERVEVSIGELLNDSRIKVGVTPFFKVNGKVVYDRSFITKCLVIASAAQKMQSTISISDIYHKFLANPQPYIFNSINDQLIISRPYLEGLLNSGIKSFMAYPIQTGDGLLGVLEIGSVEPEGISHKTIEVLQLAFPVIADLVYYMIKSFNSRIDQLIKTEFTSLQPSVEWKFNEVAWNYLVKDPQQQAEQGISNVVFEQVHPLYGAVDVRNSSIERNIASRKDYHYQLSATKKLFLQIANNTRSTLPEQLLHQCEQYIHCTAETLTPEDEIKIHEFLEREVQALLKNPAGSFGGLEHEIAVYTRNNDTETGKFTEHRRAYETSLQQINNNIIAYFNAEVKKLQQAYPFFFEKYRSDGIEYNIYIGQSIVPEQPFEDEYFQTLKLWQLSSMAHIARSNYRMLAKMPLQLQTTQLILVHTRTIDISFRKDERRFDVEGSYNIRYEIIKKRIDKVRIKDSAERLTQPDKIAIVYTNARDVEEYTAHIHSLKEKGLLTDAIEMLDLEDLQGVSGLKAIRVSVNYEL